MSEVSVDYSDFKSNNTPPSNMMVMLASQIHLNKVLAHKNTSMQHVLSLSIQEQAKYADPITIANVDSKWLAKQLHEYATRQNSSDSSSINATSIGNAAYVILHAKRSSTRQDAQRMMDNMITGQALFSKLISYLTGSWTNACSSV